MLDTRSADYAMRFFGRTQSNPFFLAIGFFRPHLPYFVPQRLLNRYPAAEMPLPAVKAADMDDVPAGAHVLMKGWTRMFRGIQQAPDARQKWREAVAGYAAGATYADEQLGRIIDAVDRSPHRDNTIIVVWSDHGYHLGEKDHWSKFVLWEKATHVPLIVIAPGVTKPGTACDRPVSLLDLYLTLVDLCRLQERSDLDGTSLVPLLHNPAAPRDRPALMTEMRGNHAVRTERWRYIRYADGGDELYDHDVDPNEWTNLAGEPRFNDVLAEHRRWLPQKGSRPRARFSHRPRCSSVIYNVMTILMRQDLRWVFTTGSSSLALCIAAIIASLPSAEAAETIARRHDSPTLCDVFVHGATPSGIMAAVPAVRQGHQLFTSYAMFIAGARPLRATNLSDDAEGAPEVTGRSFGYMRKSISRSHRTPCPR